MYFSSDYGITMNRSVDNTHNRFRAKLENIASQIIRHHYDIGNDLYRLMLDARLTYSCGYWKEARTLDQAQEHKFDLICRKLNLQPGQRILDIGCGWGSFMKYAVEKYNVSCVGITLSSEQIALCMQKL